MLQIFFAWLLLAATNGQAQNAVVLQRANLIDGRSDQPLRDVTVLVQNGRITSVAATEKAPEGALVIDLDGRWLLPGLIDAHVHLDNLTDARAMVAAGVTTVRTMHTDHYADIGIRELHRGGAKDLPDVVAGGYQLRPDMFAFEAFLLDFPQLASLVRTKVSGSENVRRLVRANVQRGVNLIKILATERAGTPGSDPRRQTFTEDEMKAIVDESRKAGLPVAAHAHGDDGVAAAVRAGVRSIEHGSAASEATLDLMRQHGTYLVPTIDVWAAVERRWQSAPPSPETQKRVAGLAAAARANALRAWKKGIPVVAGSDFPADTVPSEIAELVKYGLPPMYAIQAASSRAADLLGIADRTGTIRPGYEADLLVVDGNPLSDVAALNKVLLVINDGQVVVNRFR